MIPNPLCGVGITGPCSEALGCCPFAWVCGSLPALAWRCCTVPAVMWGLSEASSATDTGAVADYQILNKLRSSKGFVSWVLSLTPLVKFPGAFTVSLERDGRWMLPHTHFILHADSRTANKTTFCCAWWFEEHVELVQPHLPRALCDHDVWLLATSK